MADSVAHTGDTVVVELRGPDGELKASPDASHDSAATPARPDHEESK